MMALFIPNLNIAIGLLSALAVCNVFIFPGLCMTSLAMRLRVFIRKFPADIFCNGNVTKDTGSLFIWTRSLFIYGVFIIITGVVMFVIILYQVYKDFSYENGKHLLCKG